MPKHMRKPAKANPPSSVIVKGKFIGNEGGFGFVVQENPEAEDIFIPPPMTGVALHGDEVLCQLVPKETFVPIINGGKRGRRQPKAARFAPVLKPERRQTGQIVEITQRKPLTGTYYTMGQSGFIRPLEQKIPYAFSVPPRTINRFGLAEGHRVIFISPMNKPIGAAQVTEVIGHIHDPGIDVLTLVREYDVPYVFPKEAEEQAAGLPETISPDELEGRLDLRDQYIITIDGEDTKDIDDAISLTLTEEGHYRLGVHIADVSYYVKPETPLDKEAFSRGTSIYLADRVIPMLPHRLSSGICSLLPRVDRLTVSCIMTVNKNGDVIDYEITPSVINSKRRFTYQEVQELLDAPESPSVEGGFTAMNAFRETLYQKRQNRGALDFSLPEAKIRVDETGRPISIEPYPRTQATGIIEEFMILCNETIAAHCMKNHIPQIYRTHEAPSPDKLARLDSLLKPFGLSLPAYTTGSKTLQRLLETAETHPAYYGIAMAALTSLPQAFYTPDNPRHYGLGSDAYCHFTSPIRRYGDLQAHRLIRGQSDGLPLDYIASQCSLTERVAEALEREVAQLKKVQFMQDRVGEVYEGQISGITPWGAFVMINKVIEGLIPSQYLKHQGYTHDKNHNRYKSKGNPVLSMGAAVWVRLAHVSVEERKLTFSICKNHTTAFPQIISGKS